MSNAFYLDDLYKLAEDINKIRDVPAEFTVINFFAYNNHGPEIPVNLNIDILYCRSGINPLTRQRVHATGVSCRELVDIRDLDNRPIFESQNGVLFTYVDSPSGPFAINPYFTYPRLALPTHKDMSESFRQASEKIVDIMPLQVEQEHEEFSALVLKNKITALQELAYSQGLSLEAVKSHAFNQ
jgi:hypothetical protein